MTPDEKRRIRFEFEKDGKLISSLSADYGIPSSTLYDLAKRERWGLYGNPNSGPSTLPHLDRKLRRILKIMLARLDTELGDSSPQDPVPPAAQTRLDTAFRTYLKILDIQAKIQSAKSDSQPVAGHGKPSKFGQRANRDALVQTILRRLDVLRASGEVEIGARLADRK